MPNNISMLYLDVQCLDQSSWKGLGFWVPEDLSRPSDAVGWMSMLGDSYIGEMRG